MSAAGILGQVVRPLALAAVVGCTVLTSLDGISGSAPEDGGAPEDSGPAEDSGPPDADLVDAATPPVVDAGLPSEASDADTSSCTPRVLTVTNATPDGATGYTCDVANAIETDGKLVGFDYNIGATTGTLAGQSVFACVEARFDVDIGGQATIRATALDSACGGGCSGGCPGSPRLKVFAGPSSDALTFLGLITVEADAGIAPYNVFLPAAPSRVVVLCRASTGSQVDPAVDSVSADCY